MNSKWGQKSLGELLSLQRGHDLPSDSRVVGTVPVMGSAGITGYHNKATTKGPGVVIGRSGVGSMGVVSYIDQDYWALNTTLYVTDFKGNDVKFIYYLLRTINFRQFDTGSAQASLNRNLVYPHRVPFPNSKQEQAEIGSILAALDDRIIVLRKTNHTLEAIIEALFKSWFIDFDPLHAKLKGRNSDGIGEEFSELFPEVLEESELGDVPKGWGVLPVGDLIESVGGGTPDTKNLSYWNPPFHCWSTPKDLSGITSPVLFSTERKLSDEGLAKVSSGLLPVGTLLLSSRAPIGYLALTQVPMAINQGYIALLPGGILPPLYMLYWCKQNMELIKSRANGSTFMEISKKAFRSIPALVPRPEIVKAFVDIAQPMIEKIFKNEIQSKQINALRDTLLPRLMSGQLNVPVSLEV